MTFASLILLLIKLSIVLSVLAIGLKATPDSSVYLFRRPADLVKALLSMNVVMPLIAVLLCFTFALNPAVKIALVTLSVSPVPPILPNKALKAGGKEEYTIGLLVATALLSIVFIPLTVEIFQALSGIPMQVSAFQVAKLVLTSVLVPLLLGIAVRYFSTSIADRLARPLAMIGLLVLVVCVLPILFVAARSLLTVIGDGTLIALAVFAVVGLIAGHLLGGPDPDNRIVLALATSSRHPAVALAVAHANFPAQKLAGALVLVYLVLSALLAAPYMRWNKRIRTSQGNEKHVGARP